MCSTARGANKNDQAEGQHKDWSDPQEYCSDSKRWPIENEVPVAIHHETDNCIITLTRFDQLVGFQTKVTGQFGIGVCERLILANQAAQFIDQAVIARFIWCLTEAEIVISEHRSACCQDKDYRDAYSTDKSQVSVNHPKELAFQSKCQRAAWLRYSGRGYDFLTASGIGDQMLQ